MGDLRTDGGSAPAETVVLPRPTVSASAVIGGFWPRILALLVDMALLALVGIVIGAVAWSAGLFWFVKATRRSFCESFETMATFSRIALATIECLTADAEPMSRQGAMA